MNATTVQDEQYRQALATVERTLDKLVRCSAEEKEQLQADLRGMQSMMSKLTTGRIEVVVFGEISTGKSALINALVGSAVADVNVRGGWTKEIWQVRWDGCAYCVPGLADSQVILIDTPGLNEVGGQDRAEMASEVARRADLILFVTDSDLNEIEYAALVTLASVHKPMILVLNKSDLYSATQREQLLDVVRERTTDLVPPNQIVLTAADPREVEYVVESADGTATTQWRTPDPDVSELKVSILEVLDHEGMSLLALNAALYAADKSDRVASMRINLRQKKANQIIGSYAALKAIAVALNPVAVADVVGGSAVDATMIVTLAHIYGLEMSWIHARKLITSILKAAGWVLFFEATTHFAASAFKALTVGYGTVVTAVPQGAAAGYGSYIVGQAAKYYFEHGSSWGGESPKTVVRRILDETDKQSVLDRLKGQIKQKLELNPHAK